MRCKYLYFLGVSVLSFGSCIVTKTAQTSSPAAIEENKTSHTIKGVLNDEKLLARLKASADYLEILNLLAGSAFSSDIASEAYWKKMFTEDATFDMGSDKQIKGRQEILKIVSSTGQYEASKAGMTHLAMLPHIAINGDSAVATGYLLIVLPDTAASHVKLAGKGTSPGFSIYQVTTNCWELVRTLTGWKVSRRTVLPIGNKNAYIIIQQAIEEK
jgi:SnoaL-like domain